MALRPSPCMHDAAIDRESSAPEPHGRGALTLILPASPSPAESFAAASAWALTPLVGRDALVSEVTDLIANGGARLVTLTGPGGVGKTRLAAHLLEYLRPAFRDGAVFIPLASVRTSAQIVPALAAALGLTETPARSIADEVQRWLRPREMLLVLDNLEQVVDCAPVISALLADARQITLLATSRAPLAVSGEQRIVVPPLDVPTGETGDAEAVRGHAAVRLFEDRARRINPQFAITPHNAGAVAAICVQLDGLPLALELAAARTTILSPNALLERLTDRLDLLRAHGTARPERHRTMRQAIAWTYDLLPEAGQRMMRLLSLFVNGWSLELAEALEQTRLWLRWFPEGMGAIDLLHDLVDQSLVQVRMPADDGEPRFLMLETVRAFGQEQGRALGEDDDLHSAHLEAVLAVARMRAPQLDSPQRDEAYRRIDPEWENVRVAHGWALSHGRPAQALRLASAVWHVCEVKGQYSLGRAWHESAMAALAAVAGAAALPLDPPLTADEWLMARLTAAFLIEDCMDADAAEPLFRAVHTEAGANGNGWIEIQAVIGLGLVEQARAELDGAQAWFDKAAALAREIDAYRLEAIAINFVGRLAILRMDMDAARRIFERARAVAVRIGDRRLEARYLNNLAVVALEEADADRAEGYLRQASALQQGADDVSFQAILCANVGNVHRLRGDFDRARQQFQAALDLIAPIEAPGQVAYFLLGLAAVSLDRGEDSDVIHHAGTALACSRDLDEPFLLAMAVLALLRLAVLRERWPIAAELLALGDRVRERIGMAWTQEERRKLTPIRTRVGATLPRGQTTASVFDRALLDADGKLDLLAARDRIDELVVRLGSPPPMDGSQGERTMLRPARRNLFGLTAREQEVLALLGRGASSNEIADTLSISVRTATTHVSNILGKLGVSSRAAAIAVAARNGLL